jgi:hypothetical protein
MEIEDGLLWFWIRSHAEYDNHIMAIMDKMGFFLLLPRI